MMRLESGPLEGDQQIGSRISEGQIDSTINDDLTSRRFSLAALFKEWIEY